MLLLLRVVHKKLTFEGRRDVKLLSFGAEEEAEEEPVLVKKKPIVRPDCMRLTHLYQRIVLTVCAVLEPDTPSIPGVPPQSSKKSSKRERPDEGSSEPVLTLPSLQSTYAFSPTHRSRRKRSRRPRRTKTRT